MSQPINAFVVIHSPGDASAATKAIAAAIKSLGRARTMRMIRGRRRAIGALVSAMAFFPRRSVPPLGNETRSRAQDVGLGAEGHKGCLRVGNQRLEFGARAFDTERRYQRRLAGGGVLAGGLADGCGVALDIEQVVGDLERLSDRGTVAIDVRHGPGVGLSEDGAG